MARSLFSLVVFLLTLAPIAAAAQDVEGSSDPEVIGGRYPDSRIVRYTQTEFEELKLLTGPVRTAGQPETFERVEGELTRVTYEVDARRSVLEVFRNYQIALRDKGFEVLYECHDADCGGRAFNHTVVPYWSGFAENYRGQRYLAARRVEGNATHHVAVYVTKNYSSGGATKDKVYVQVDVVESAAMDTGMEVVPADEMRERIDQTGRVAINTIHFDFDSATIRAESAPTLEEIAKLLRDNPDLSVLVVGHTDNQGALDYNIDLSRRRAEAVVRSLVDRHGIAASRLSGHGVGFLAPVASNESEAGRQQNRRVELVKR